MIVLRFISLQTIALADRAMRVQRSRQTRRRNDWIPQPCDEDRQLLLRIEDILIFQSLHRIHL